MDAESHTDLSLSKSRLIQAVNGLGTLIERAKSAAVDALHEIYNDKWRGDGANLSQVDFANRLEPCSLWVDEDHDVGISFSTDDMFPGHAIRVDFDDSLEPRTPRLW